MKLLRPLAVALAATTALPALAQDAVFPGDNTSGTYMDYMKTVYSRAGFPEIIQLPMTSFDKTSCTAWAPRTGRSPTTA